MSYQKFIIKFLSILALTLNATYISYSDKNLEQINKKSTHITQHDDNSNTLNTKPNENIMNDTINKKIQDKPKTPKTESNKFILENNIYYKKNNTEEAIIYIHGRNDNLYNILKLNINHDLYCLLSPNIIKKSNKDIYHRRNWFKSYAPVRLILPLCVNKILKTIECDNKYLLDEMYNDIKLEIDMHLKEIIPILFKKIKNYKRIKIIGFSQGGMAAHILANKIEELGKKVDLVISIASFMITKSKVKTLAINNFTDDVITWNMFLGSLEKFSFNKNTSFVKVNNDIIHSKWPWVNTYLEEIFNLSSNTNAEIIKTISEKYEFKYKGNFKKNNEVKFNFSDYLISFIYYLSYIPATIIDLLI